MNLQESINRPSSMVDRLPMCRRFCVLITLMLLGPGTGSAIAQQGGNNQTAVSGNTEEQVVDYSSTYFSKYKPNTVLDMVQQVPDFILDDINDNRGYGASAGNVLLNGRRPSSKEDLLSAILGRIPAGQVERVELIRGQVTGVDLRGHTVVANVILMDNSPAEVRWEAGVRRNTLVRRLLFRGNVSVSDNWNSTDYNLGFSGERDLSPVGTRELSEELEGIRITFAMSGSFQ